MKLIHLMSFLTSVRNPYLRFHMCEPSFLSTLPHFFYILSKLASKATMNFYGELCMIRASLPQKG